jgi:putative selenium metabolism protein SsnA
MSLILANGWLAQLSPSDLTRRHVIIEGDRIARLAEDLPKGDHQVVDCAGRIIIPGNVCAHTHVYSALARGMPGPRRAPRNFLQILEEVWWPLDSALDESGIRASGHVAALDAIRSGTTTLVDHHASPNAIHGSLDLLAETFTDVGLRGVLCYEVTDRGGRERRDAGLRENERFMRENHRPALRGLIGAHASFTLEDDTLRELADLAAGVNSGVHIHVAEDQHDEADAVRRSGKRAALRLDDAGVFRPKSIAAHGVHLDGQELDAVKGRGAWLVHNCRSNMNNSVGRAPVFGFGARAALGTDGIDEDMFAESRAAFFRARDDTLDATADRFAQMLVGGGQMVSALFDRSIGSLEPGSAADLVILRYDPPTDLNAANLAWHWMFSFTPSLVESVLVNGDWVLRDGEFCKVDEERLRAEARVEARRLWQRMEAQ